MRNDILIVMKTEMRHNTKALALEAVAEWLELATHFQVLERCLQTT